MRVPRLFVSRPPLSVILSPAFPRPPMTTPASTTTDTPQVLLVLLAHGSRDPRWREPFERLVQELPPLDDTQVIRLAFMEMAEPTLAQVVADTHATWRDLGVPNGHVVVLPLFMAAGSHLANDVPPQLAALREQYPTLTFEQLSPIGEHRLVRLAMHEVIAKTLEGTGSWL